MKIIVASRWIITAALAASFSCHASEQEPWVVGFWKVVADENEDTSLNQVMEFRQDGGFILYDTDCSPLNSANEGTYQLNGNDIYVTSIYGTEGPASLLIHADEKRIKLTLTFPDSNKPLTIERIPSNKCVGQG